MSMVRFSWADSSSKNGQWEILKSSKAGNFLNLSTSAQSLILVVEMLRDCRPGGSFGKESVAGSSDTGHSARDSSSNLGSGSQDQNIEILCVSL